jgi:hypothetical protein
MDSTQYKRAAAVGLGSLAALAGGTDELAARILQENIGRGLARMGESHTKGLGYMADVKSAADLNGAWRDARVAIQHAAEIEKAVIRSASILYTDVDAGKKRTAAFEPLIDKRAAALLDETTAVYQLQAAQRGVAPAAQTPPPPAKAAAPKAGAAKLAVTMEPTLTAEEQAAANLVVEVTPPAGGAGGGRGGAGGGRGGAGGGRGGGRGGPSLPTEYNAEFSAILGRKMTVLEIRDFLSGEFSPLPLSDVMAVLKAREAAGSIKLVPKAPAAPIKK